MSHFPTTNAQLRDLVEASGLAQPVALTIFNRGLGCEGLTLSEWKALLCDPNSAGHLPLNPELLVHAQQQFKNITPVR